jgi:hypothetical protein
MHSSTTPGAAVPTSTVLGSGPGGSSEPASSPPPGAVVLGRDLQPIDQAQCRSPDLAQGAAWQFGEVKVAGHPFPTAYYCDLFAGGVGSLDFVLSKAYSQLSLTAGFADTSQATVQTIKLEIVGDGKVYLTPPKTLRFGEAVDFKVNVAGITRVELKITELSPPGGSGAPSQPALAGLSLST